MVSVFGTEQGLSQSMVRQVCQDYRGLIWMVSGDGLQCFNGSEFKVFRVDLDHRESYSENIMREIVEIQPGQFIISTTSSLLLFNSSTGKFKSLVCKPGNCPRLFNLLLDKQGICWFPNDGYSLIEGERLKPLNLPFQGARPPLEFYPTRAFKTKQGTLLIEGSEGIIEAGFERKGINTVVKYARWIAFPAGCQGLAKDDNDILYVLSGKSIFTYTPGGKLRQICALGDIRGDYLYKDKQNRLWVTDRNEKKVYILEGGRIQEVKLFSIEGRHTDFLSPAVLDIFEDSHQNIWMGTDGDGVLLFSTGLIQFQKYMTGFTRSLVTQGENVYAGTFRNGLWRLSKDLASAERVNPGELNDQLYFLDLETDPSGRVWAITNEGLLVINQQGTVIYRIKEKFNSASFIGKTADAIQLIAGNELLVFTISKQPQLISRKFYSQVRELLSFKGRTWIATPFGLYMNNAPPRYDLDAEFGKSKLVTSVPVFKLLQLKDTLWAATESGIKCFSLISGQALEVPASLNDIQHDVTYSLLVDRKNRIWFSGIKGVGCILAGRNRVVRFNIQNNLQSLEFNSNATAVSQEGYLYFGGINGVNMINPETFLPDKKGPEVKLFALNLSDTAYSQGIPPDFVEVELNRNAANISGSVFAMDYPSSGMQQYSFFLEGYQDRWSAPSSNAAFTYRNIPPGSYKLWIRCTDAYRNQGEACHLMNITVRPPYWQSLWFRIGSSLFLLLLTILVVRKFQDIRYRSKLRILEHQNLIEKERLRISKDMHDEIGASLTRISILTELVKKQQIDNERAGQLIEQINSISGKVVDEMSEIIWAINPKNDNLESFASYFRQYASGYLEEAGIEGHFAFQDQLPPIAMSAEIRRNLFLTLKEALHNIVKHSGAKRADISLHFQGNSLELDVKDHGKGFEPGCCQEHGNGLSNMKKRIETCGGSFSMITGSDSGCHIMIKVQLNAR